jgi:hypothetical protein
MTSWCWRVEGNNRRLQKCAMRNSVDHQRFVEVLKRCFMPELTCSQNQSPEPADALPNSSWQALPARENEQFSL